MRQATNKEYAHELPSRVMRGVAWVGVIYGVASAVYFATLGERIGRSGWRWLMPTSDFRIVSLATDVFLPGLGIWLLFLCMRLLRGRVAVRGYIFAWAIWTLGLHLLAAAMYARVQSSMQRPPTAMLISAITFLLPQIPFAFIVAWLMSIRQFVSQSSGVQMRAFEVLPVQCGLGRPDRVHETPHASAGFDSRPLARAVLRCIGWTALGMGLMGAVFAAKSGVNWPLSWTQSGIDARGLAMSIFTDLEALSYIPLLGGAALILLGRNLGRKIVIAWSIAFLVIAAGHVVSFDIIDLWWSSKHLTQWTFLPMLAGNRLFFRVQSVVFPILVIHLLRQPEVAAVISGDPQRTPARDRSCVAHAG